MRSSLPFLLLLLLCGCGTGGKDALVVYTSQDRVYAEGILAEFTRRTGVEVRPVYDSEAVKTLGLFNRLVAESENPQCDLFWSNEEMMMRQLRSRGIVADDGIVTFGYRTRRIVINTDLVSRETLTLRELTDPRWRGKVALAYPLFGTTATHFAALQAAWGREAFREWCRGLVDNEVRIVDGNSMVVRLVGAGEVSAGLTDIDDVGVGLRNGLPVRALPPGDELCLIANTAALVHGAPRPGKARRLQDFLQERDTLESLVECGALEGIVADDMPRLEIEWDPILDDLDETREWLMDTFLR